MLCTLTARRLKPGSYDAFRAAWDPGDAPPDVIARWDRIYHVRDVTDPNVVISFGFFDGTIDDLRALSSDVGRDEQLERVNEHVDEILLDGSYEVVEQMSGADFGG